MATGVWEAYEGVCRFECIFWGIFSDFHDNVQIGAEASLLAVWTWLKYLLGLFSIEKHTQKLFSEAFEAPKTKILSSEVRLCQLLRKHAQRCMKAYEKAYVEHVWLWLFIFLSKTLCECLKPLATYSLNPGDSFTYPQNVCGTSKS